MVGSLGLVMASLAGATGGSFYIPRFSFSGIATPQALGKLSDKTWRKSKHAMSLRSRANNRKAKRKAKNKD